MKRYHLIIDVAKCENCGNCFLACKDEHVGNDWPGYSASQPNLGSSWIRVMAKERGKYPQIDVSYLPVPCMHCDEAPCVRVAGGAAAKRLDGIVLLDPDKAKGHQELTAACPYDAIQWNEELQTAQKCTLCAHLLDTGWERPRCVQSCPTGALRFLAVDDTDMDGIIREEKLETHKPKAGTRPVVYYKNLYRFTRRFIAGSVATRASGREECVEEALVTLFDEVGKVKGEMRTDPFGDFKFDGLERAGEQFALHVLWKGREAGPITVVLDESVSMGVIYL